MRIIGALMPYLHSPLSCYVSELVFYNVSLDKVEEDKKLNTPDSRTGGST